MAIAGRRITWLDRPALRLFDRIAWRYLKLQQIRYCTDDVFQVRRAVAGKVVCTCWSTSICNSFEYHFSSTLSCACHVRPPPLAAHNTSVVCALRWHSGDCLGNTTRRYANPGYRVQTRNVSIVFSSDQTGTDPHFTGFAKGMSSTCI